MNDDHITITSSPSEICVPGTIEEVVSALALKVFGAKWVPPEPVIEPEYRLLDVGEIIRLGDIYLNFLGHWVPAEALGNKVPDDYVGRYRRPLTDTPPPRTAEARLAETREVALALLEWIDAVPQDVVLPAMPGIDRDWVNRVLKP